MITDHIKNAASYKNISDRIKKALDYLENEDLKSLTTGKYELDGDNLFVLIQEYEGKQVENGKCEAHKNYIDIQYIIEGCERMGYGTVDTMEVIEEYDAAKEAQGLLEAKIAQLRGIVANSRIIDETKIDTSKVQMMNKVTIKNQKNGAVMTYTLVSETEADFKQGKLSINTPIAKGLIGKVVGDIVEIQVPNGLIPFEIVDISI